MRGRDSRDVETKAAALDTVADTMRGAEPTPVVAERLPSLEVGQVLGRYRIDSLVGAGAMGEVYAALDTDLDRRVGIKVLRRGGGGHRAAERLLREAKAMARLRHPNVVTVYEVGSERGVDFVAMEFIEGLDLQAWARSRPEWRDVVDTFIEAGKGVAAAHEAGLVHRDLKPANILRAADGRVLVLDFGVARLPDAAPLPGADTEPEIPTALTQEGTFVGTPAYAAPEQFAGEANPKTDQYSLCASLYDVLFGQRPPSARPGRDRPQALSRPESVAVPAWVWNVVARGMDHDPAKRFASVDELVVTLEHRSHLRVTTGAAAVVALIGVGVLWAQGTSPDSGSPPCDPSKTLRWQEAAEPWPASSRAGKRLRGQTTFALDAYAQAWSSSWADACSHQTSRGTQRRGADDPRLQCLDAGRREADALVRDSAQSQTDAEFLQLLGAVRRLSPVAACNEEPPGPPLAKPSPAAEESTRLIRAKLLALHEGLPSSPLIATLDEAKALVAEAKEAGFPVLVAEAHAVHGAALWQAEHATEARAAYEEAAVLAEEVGHRRVLAHARVALALIDVELWDKPDSFDRKVRRARLAVARYGGEGLDRRLDEVVAAAHQNRGELAEAVQAQESVVARGREAVHADPLALARSETTLGSFYEAQENPAKATEVLKTAVARLLDAYGSDVHLSLIARDHLATVLREQGKWDLAHEQTEAIAAYLVTASGRGLVEATFEPWRDHLALQYDRQTSVRVLDSEGSPVSGARVVSARSIDGDGRYAAAGDLKWWVQSGAFVAATGAEGAAIVEHPDDRTWVVAEHALGRSWPVPLEGETDGSMELTLRPWSRLEGSVAVLGAGPESTTISVFPAGLEAGRDLNFHVGLKEDGSFEIPRLAIGDYVVGVQVSWGGDTLLVHRFDVTVAQGDRAAAELKLVVPSNLLKVRVTGAQSTRRMRTRIYVASGTFAAPEPADLVEALVVAARSGPLAVGGIEDGEVELHGLPLGRYTLCIMTSDPLGDDPQDQRESLIDMAPTIQCDPLQIDSEDMDVPVALAPTTFRVPSAG